MRIRKFEAMSLGRTHDDCEITCTKEEAKMLTYALELVGVNVGVSMIEGENVHIYFNNEYKNTVGCSFKPETIHEIFQNNKRAMHSLKTDI